MYILPDFIAIVNWGPLFSYQLFHTDFADPATHRGVFPKQNENSLYNPGPTTLDSSKIIKDLPFSFYFLQNIE